MKNIFSRFFLVAATIPLLYVIIIYLPYWGHGATVLISVIFTAGCGVELARLFTKRGINSSTSLFSILALLPSVILWTALRLFPQKTEVALIIFLLGFCISIIILLASFVFPKKSHVFSYALVNSAVKSFPLIYPGLFSAAIVLIADYPGASTQALLWFALLVFGNDSAAWAVGIALGRHRGIISVSPNKSLEGFLGAFAGSLGASFLGPVLFPDVINGTPWKLVFLGIIVGLAVIIGDLFESALKRSAEIKDSGNMIPGRGGFLDSFDSILFAAPVYYSVVRFLNLL